MRRDVANKSAPQSYWLKACNCWVMASFDRRPSCLAGWRSQSERNYCCYFLHTAKKTIDQEKSSIQPLASFVVLKSITGFRGDFEFLKFQIHLTKRRVCKYIRFRMNHSWELLLRPPFNKSCFYIQPDVMTERHSSSRTNVVCCNRSVLVDKGIFTVLDSLLVGTSHPKSFSIIHTEEEKTTKFYDLHHIHVQRGTPSNCKLTTISVIFIFKTETFRLIRRLECWGEKIETTWYVLLLIDSLPDMEWLL